MRNLSIMNGYFHTACYQEAGEGHISQGKPCEDAVRTGVRNGVAIAVLSDGAGSCEHAAEGAQIVTDTAFALIAEQFDSLYDMTEQECAEVLLTAVREALAETAERMGYDDKSLSATMLCTALAEDGRYFYFHVGDGVIAGCTPEGECCVLSHYVHDIAPNFTTFVTLPDAEYQWGKGRNSYRAFFLMSDGPEAFLLMDDGRLTSRGDSALYLSFFFDEEMLEQELQMLTELLKEWNMYDDASYALLADKRSAGSVSAWLPGSLSEILFGKKRISRRKLRHREQLFRRLSECGHLTLRQTGVILHTYRKKRTQNALEPFINSGILHLKDEICYFD